MRKFNFNSNTDYTIVSVFWSAAAQVIKMDTFTVSHQRRQAAVDEETTNNVSYAPNVLSVQELVDKAKGILIETDAKKGGVDFLVPSLSWAYLQLSPSQGNRKTEER